MPARPINPFLRFNVSSAEPVVLVVINRAEGIITAKTGTKASAAGFCAQRCTQWALLIPSFAIERADGLYAAYSGNPRMAWWRDVWPNDLCKIRE